LSVASDDEPVWLGADVAVAINARSIAVWGGQFTNVRDENLLRAAIARPLNKWHFNPVRPTIFELAAAYCFALAKGHVFQDANKRTAYVVSVTFLERNGIIFAPDLLDAIRMLDAAAEGSATEDDLANWFERNSK